MSATLNDVQIGNDWVSINSTTGIAVGTAMSIQNKSTTWVLLQESSTKPNIASNNGILITDLFHQEPSKEVLSGSLEIWAKSTVTNRPATLSVQSM